MFLWRQSSTRHIFPAQKLELLNTNIFSRIWGNHTRTSKLILKVSATIKTSWEKSRVSHLSTKPLLPIPFPIILMVMDKPALLRAAPFLPLSTINVAKLFTLNPHACSQGKPTTPRTQIVEQHRSRNRPAAFNKRPQRRKNCISVFPFHFPLAFKDGQDHPSHRKQCPPRAISGGMNAASRPN